MRNLRSASLCLSRVALSVALAAGVALTASDVDAQSRGGKPGASFPGAKPAGGSGWGGRHDGWRGGGGRHWNHDRGHFFRGQSRHGHHWHGWHRGRYFYPGWAFGLGVGIGLTYPWWGWHYPDSYVVYERVYDPPVGVVIDRDGPAIAPPAYRWYCPSPPGYHPDIRECPAGWLKVLPHDGAPPSAVQPPSTAPRSTAPRSTAPSDDEPASWIPPGTMGDASSSRRIAAPRMGPPAQLTGGYGSQETVAENATQ